ncbi:hypothetical protein JCM8547_005187 [Rhodosporidiobolus lusitaniae]
MSSSSSKAGESTTSLQTPSSPPSTRSGSSGSTGISASTAPMSPALSFWSPSGARRRPGRIFKSTKINPEVYKDRTPWQATPLGKSTLRRTRWTCLAFSSIGLLGAAALIVTAWLAIPKHDYCIVLDEQFDGPLDTSVWHHEVQVGGFGNKEFQMATADPANSYTEDGVLYIVPTLSNETYGNDAIMDGLTLNFTADGTCTSTSLSDCVAFSNNTVGNYSVIPPIRSARISTKLSHSIRFGKIEVKARMPTGDWIWPAIWMLPTDSVYGVWPASGEIDIVESRGNGVENWWDITTNTAQSTLHWGLDSYTDRYTKTTSWRTLKRHYLNKLFYTYGLYWDTKGIRTWLSKPSKAILGVDFNKSFWKRGDLSSATVNGTVATNPWVASEYPKAAPFDQDFHLILSVAVGGTNGWFPDSGTKPWANGAPHAARDFWVNRDTWLPTWPSDPKQRGMAVESVRIWRLKEKGETAETCKVV